MKTIKTSRSLILATLVLLACSTGLLSAQTLHPESNWLQAWKNFAGAQYASTWIGNEMANGAHLYTAAGNTELVITLETDWNDLDELLSGLEEGILDGNATQLMANGSTEAIGQTAGHNLWKGTIGGRNVFATLVAELQENGGSQVIMRLSTVPVHESVEVRQEEALALLGQFQGQMLKSPLVLDAK